MRNRIRFHRKQRGLTMAELAARVGTTAQTISRLETEAVAVSTEWLSRIAAALGIAPEDLIEVERTRDIPFAGRVGADGWVQPARREDAAFRLVLPADQPLAVTLTAQTGPYAAGETLICNRLDRPDLPGGVVRDCLVGLADGRTLLRRVARGPREGLTLMPVGAEGEVKYNQKPRWLAEVVLRVRSV